MQYDFQEFLITRLLLLCNKAQFLHTPLEQEHVPKEAQQCNQSIYTHFQTKPVLHFSFLPEQASIIRKFVNNLDAYAQEYDLAESELNSEGKVIYNKIINKEHNNKEELISDKNKLLGFIGEKTSR